MAYNFFIDPDTNCIFVRHSGTVTLDEIAALHDGLVGRDDYSRNMNVLRDMREADLSSEFEYQAFKAWADENINDINRELGVCRVAWVLGTRDDFAKAHRIKHIFRFKYSSVEMDGFRKFESALKWLDVPLDHEWN